MASVSSGKKGVKVANSDARRQVIRKYVESHLKTYFASTLNTQPDIVNIVTALCYLESSFNANAMGKPIPIAISSGARDYIYADTVQNAILKESLKSNAYEGLQAIGLMQIMGWNVVIGGSKKNGRCEIERIRPDLVGTLCVKAGDSITAKYLDKFAGEQGISNSVLAGLAILEDKWNNVFPVKGGYQVKGDKYKRIFPLRISGAVAAYLGLGKADVVTKITPEQYAERIVGGSTYQVANGSTSPVVFDSNVQTAQVNGPIITIASGDRKAPTGCTAKNKA